MRFKRSPPFPKSHTSYSLFCIHSNSAHFNSSIQCPCRSNLCLSPCRACSFVRLKRSVWLRPSGCFAPFAGIKDNGTAYVEGEGAPYIRRLTQLLLVIAPQRNTPNRLHKTQLYSVHRLHSDLNTLLQQLSRSSISNVSDIENAASRIAF